MSQDVPFSLTWLRAVNPETFTPQTWANTGATTIRLRAGDGSVRINVFRMVFRYLDTGNVTLKDEVYALRPEENEAGNQDVTQFKYTFDANGRLMNFDPSPAITERMQTIVNALGGLVTIPDSKIEASNYDTGKESSFASDGTQWIDTRTGSALQVQPAIPASQPALPPAANS